MNTYNGDPTNFPTSIEVLDDGDEAEAATIAPAEEALMDAVQFLHRSLAAPGDSLQLTLTGAEVQDKFQYVLSPGVAAGWLQNSVVGAGSLVIELPNTVRYYEFSAIDAFVIGSVSGGGHGALPATMPRIKLYRWLDPDQSPGPDLIATQIDASGTAGAYDQNHRITMVLGATEVIDHTAGAISGFPYARYFIELQGEAGANSIANEFFLKAIILS